MREILFRAKRIDNGEWVDGNLITNERADHKKYIGYIFDERNGVIEDFDIVEVIPNTICQYIGLNDKKGNRIWENDVVSINTYSYVEPEEDYFGKVVYAEGWGCWCIQQPGEEKPIPLCECEGSYLTERVVEGNIFDNPELLNGE